MNTTTTRQAKSIEQLITDVQTIAQHQAQLAAETLALEKRLRVARGTADVTKEAKRATRPATTYSTREADNVSTPELYNAIRLLITERPMRFRDLVDATHAGENRIKGVLVRLQRDDVGVVNLGDNARALWFIPNPELLKRLRRSRSRK